MKGRVSERGRIAIPKRLRERLGITAGQVLEFVGSGRSTDAFIDEVRGPGRYDVITAVDSNVLIDILEPDPGFGQASATALRDAIAHGGLVACDGVWAEVAARIIDPTAT